jgi:hypothetical protein
MIVKGLVLTHKYFPHSSQSVSGGSYYSAPRHLCQLSNEPNDTTRTEFLLGGEWGFGIAVGSKQ